MGLKVHFSIKGKILRLLRLINGHRVRMSRIGYMLLICLCMPACMERPAALLDYVDPFICTLGDHGQLYPGAVVPFGMIKLCPDTYPSSLSGDGDWAHSGYNYADTQIRGFSHLRKGSSGGTQIFDRMWLLSFLPWIGEPEISPGKKISSIDKSSEQASPGLYTVVLSDHKIHAALTVNQHVGFHKYIFPQSESAHIIIDTGSKARLRKSTIEIIGPDEVTGSIDSQGKIYFVARFSKPFQSYATWEDSIRTGQKRIAGKRVGAILDFHTAENEAVYVKVGFSTISIEQAAGNLMAEIPAWDFNLAVQQAREAWERVLHTIEVEGKEEYKKIFYTALYHSFLQPSNTTDMDGRYTGFDGDIHTAEGYTHYDNYAFWDSYRTKYPLLSLIAPAKLKDIVLSILDIYEQSSDYWFYGDEKHRPHQPGFSATGPSRFTPFLNCRNEHMLTVVLDAYKKGIITTDIERAYGGMRKEVMIQMPDKYESIGFIPARPDQTCELAYDNWCVAQMALLLNRHDEYQKFIKRSTFYRNTWDSEKGFFRARAADGTWLDFPDDPSLNREKYTYEGSPWHWRWFVPHDIPGLIELTGGKEQFVTGLDYFFSENLYQAGNQPDIHAPFLFNQAGAPWLTQKWVRKILTEPILNLYGTHQFFEQPIHDRVYKAAPDGYLLEMDDDYGCMAAWYVLSSIGLYQIAPGEPVYQLTAPIFDKVTIRLDKRFYSGGIFNIEARNLSAENTFIQSVTLNGETYHQPWISHQDIVKGGNLIFQMDSKPNKEWGLNGRTKQEEKNK